MSKVYVVIEEGWKDGYGSYPFLIGVFDSKEDAEKMVERSADMDEPRVVIEIEKNKEFPLTEGEYYYFNDYSLGGYAE